MGSLTVIKRDGNVENWSDDKIVTSIGKTGVSIKDAENISSNVKKRILNNSKDSKISSTKIRKKVIEELQNFNPTAADSYGSYKK